jgi:hypothetical protein
MRDVLLGVVLWLALCVSGAVLGLVLVASGLWFPR